MNNTIVKVSPSNIPSSAALSIYFDLVLGDVSVYDVAIAQTSDPSSSNWAVMTNTTVMTFADYDRFTQSFQSEMYFTIVTNATDTETSPAVALDSPVYVTLVLAGTLLFGINYI